MESQTFNAKNKPYFISQKNAMQNRSNQMGTKLCALTLAIMEQIGNGKANTINMKLKLCGNHLPVAKSHPSNE